MNKNHQSEFGSAGQFDWDDQPPPPVEIGADPRSEEQLDRIAQIWIDQRTERFGPDRTLNLAMALKGDRRLYGAIMAKLQADGPTIRPAG